MVRGRMLKSHSWIQLKICLFCSDVYGCCLVWSGIDSNGDISVLSKWFSQQQWFALWSQTLVPGESHVAVYLYYMYVQMYNLMGCSMYIFTVTIAAPKDRFAFLFVLSPKKLAWWIPNLWAWVGAMHWNWFWEASNFNIYPFIALTIFLKWSHLYSLAKIEKLSQTCLWNIRILKLDYNHLRLLYRLFWIICVWPNCSKGYPEVIVLRRLSCMLFIQLYPSV